MSEKEKKAFETLDKFVTEHKIFNIKHIDGLEDNIEIILYLITKQQLKINKALEFIDKNRYTDDNGCSYEWEAIDNIDELVSILRDGNKYEM